jgi:hypothetical protein
MQPHSATQTERAQVLQSSIWVHEAPETMCGVVTDTSRPGGKHEAGLPDERVALSGQRSAATPGRAWRLATGKWADLI